MKYWTVSFEDKRVNGYFTKEQAYQIGVAWILKIGRQVELRQHGQYRESVGIVDCLGLAERKRVVKRMVDTV